MESVGSSGSVGLDHTERRLRGIWLQTDHDRQSGWFANEAYADADYDRDARTAHKHADGQADQRPSHGYGAAADRNSHRDGAAGHGNTDCHRNGPTNQYAAANGYSAYCAASAASDSNPRARFAGDLSRGR